MALGEKAIQEQKKTNAAVAADRSSITNMGTALRGHELSPTSFAGAIYVCVYILIANNIAAALGGQPGTSSSVWAIFLSLNHGVFLPVPSSLSLRKEVSNSNVMEVDGLQER